MAKGIMELKAEAAQQWQSVIAELKPILLDCDLIEEIKWGGPCYTFRGSNIVMIQPFKEYCALGFFKGALLKDPNGILVQSTRNIQEGRQIRFTHSQEVTEIKDILKAYIYEAIEVEKSGVKVELKKTAEYDVPAELTKIFDNNPYFQSAFSALTPGRQRGYLLYFSGAKQSATRTARIEKCMDKIIAGKGLND